MVVRELLIEVSAELEQAGADIPPNFPRPEDLRDRAGGLPPPQLELEEPVTHRRVSLGEKQVVFRLGVDVGNSPAVPEDLDALLQTRNGDRLLGGLPRSFLCAKLIPDGSLEKKRSGEKSHHLYPGTSGHRSTPGLWPYGLRS